MSWCTLPIIVVAVSCVAASPTASPIISPQISAANPFPFPSLGDVAMKSDSIISSGQSNLMRRQSSDATKRCRRIPKARKKKSSGFRPPPTNTETSTTSNGDSGHDLSSNSNSTTPSYTSQTRTKEASGLGNTSNTEATTSSSGNSDTSGSDTTTSSEAPKTRKKKASGFSATSNTETAPNSGNSDSAGSSGTSTSDSSSTGSSSSDGNLTQEEQDMLSLHNSFRAKHGADPLVWSRELSGFAQQWADRCVYQHSQRNNFKYGENIAHSGGMNGFTMSTAGKLFNDEESLYDPRNPVFGHATGHFTQVVWKSTKQLGCAVQTCPGMGYGRPARFVVCEYFPPGNYAGKFEENVQK